MMDPKEYAEVTQERHDGKTWQQIGKTRGLSKATVQGRHDREVNRRLRTQKTAKKPAVASSNGTAPDEIRKVLEAQINLAREVEILAARNVAAYQKAWLALKDAS